MYKFEVGQRVRFMHDYEYFAIGIIRYIDEFGVAMEIEQTDMPNWSGHDCDGWVEFGKGWWVSHHELDEVAGDDANIYGVEISSDDLNKILSW